MRKKWLVPCVSVMAAMSLFIGGCSGGGSTPTAAEKPKTQGETPNANANAEDKFKFPLAEPVKLKVLANTAPQVKKDYNEMQMFKELNEMTNVDVEWTQVGWEHLAEKKNIIIASGDLPDVFYGRGVLLDQEIVKLGSQGALIPLEGMIEQYAPNLQKVFEQRPEFKKMLTAPDGHIYTLPTFVERDFNEIGSVLFINKKWLDQLGLSMPETIDDFYKVLKAFKEKDPNGNGKPDEVPFSFLFNNAQNGANALAGSFGIKLDDPRNNLYVDNGTVKYAPEQPEYENYMQYMNKLFKEKLIDPEVFTHDQNTYLTKVRSEDVPIGSFFTYSNQGAFGTFNEDYVPVLPLKGANGEQGWLRMPVSLSKGAFAITSNNKHPEVTLKWMDTMYEEKLSFQFEVGPIGLTVKENPDGTFDKQPVPEGMNSGDFKHSEAPGNGAAVMVLKDMVDRLIDDQADEKREHYKMYMPFASTELIHDMLWSAEDGETLAAINLDLNGKNGYYASTFAKFVMNGFSDADWDKHLAQLKKLRVDEYVALYQKYYDAANGK
ncbi:extracellular solute-binding protein, family 1 [Paenibacillus algicola]|uniref:Extracellular solute-binding protein, family 1 n=1 Tax=Paenibacillus algicola TaxID=2565926 RepID=A0A4P8XF23_9BACL|nr:extracellular solute-binding protein [Paenibacillus algicola]QCT00962.1 extracellular solute-binding protein, family 1 [Paenibacillus algicola]